MNHHICLILIALLFCGCCSTEYHVVFRPSNYSFVASKGSKIQELRVGHRTWSAIRTYDSVDSVNLRDLDIQIDGRKVSLDSLRYLNPLIVLRLSADLAAGNKFFGIYDENMDSLDWF